MTSITVLHRYPLTLASQVWLYFIGFLILSRLVLGPFFLAVLLDHLGQVQGTAVTTTLQRNWKRFQTHLDKARPYSPAVLPHSSIRRSLFLLSNNKVFQGVCHITLVLNVLVLASVYYNMDPAWAAICYWLNVAFVSVYIFEMLCRLAAIGVPFLEDVWYCPQSS
jgi:hypothetical protein